MGDGFHSLLFSTSEIFNAKVLNKCKSLGKYIWVRTLSITLTIITQERLSSLHASRPAGAGKKSAPLRLSNKLSGGRHSSFYSVRPCELQVRPVPCSGNSFVSSCYFYCTAAVVLGDGGGHCFVGDDLFFLMFSTWNLLVVQWPQPALKQISYDVTTGILTFRDRKHHTGELRHLQLSTDAWEKQSKHEEAKMALRFQEKQCWQKHWGKLCGWHSVCFYITTFAPLMGAGTSSNKPPWNSKQKKCKIP